MIIVDSGAAIRRAWARALLGARFEVLTAEDEQASWSLIRASRPAVGIVELAAFQRARTAWEDSGLCVIIACAADTEEWTEPDSPDVFAIIPRAPDPPRGLAVLVRSAVRASAARRAAPPAAAPPPVAVSRAMRRARELCTSAADTAAPVLIIGEPGVGKRSLARYVHGHGLRSGAPCIEIGCAALAPALLADSPGKPGELMESALFGDGGAYMAAGEGTVLLDRVEALPPPLQRTLASALRSGKLSPRTIATATPALRDHVKTGVFDQELFFRLAGIVIDVPPLRTRRDDIPVLAQLLVQSVAARQGVPARRIGAEALRRVRNAEWVGNVPELEAAIEGAVAMSRGEALVPGDFGSLFADETSTPADLQPYGAARERTLRAFETSYASRILEHAGGNVTRAAALAGMDRANFRRMLKRVSGRVK